MAITDIKRDSSTTACIVRMTATNTLAEVAATGYITAQNDNIEAINNGVWDWVVGDSVLCVCSDGNGFFEFDGDDFATMMPIPEGNGGVTLPVVDGDFSVFDGTGGGMHDLGYKPSNAAKTNVVMASAAVIVNHIACFTDVEGTVNDDASTAINGGNIQAGLSGTAGYVASFPSAASKGSLRMTAVANTGDTVTTISNAAMGQASTIIIPDPGVATAYTANYSINTSGTLLSAVIWKDILVLASDLAAAAQFVVQVSNGSEQYQVREIRVNYSAGLSGGGGDRLVRLTDGTTVWNNAGITAALLGTPVNTIWSGSGNPVPASGTSMSTLSQAGADIYLVYSGGAADYTTGSVLLSFCFQRVA